MVRLLKSGKVPEERQGTIVEMIGRRGSAADLDYLYHRALSPEGFPRAIRLKALEALADAEQTRRVRPDGDLSKLGALIAPKAGQGEEALRLAAIRLAGLWKVGGLGDDLRAIALDAKSGRTLRASALDALATINNEASREGIKSLADPGRPREVRIPAVAALARIDPDAAIERAVSVLRDAPPSDDLTPLVEAITNNQGGADRLAESIARDKLPADAARLALRALYEIGRSDAGLVAELTKAAGIDAEVKPPDKAELQRLVAAVAAEGDPERGEDVFRRADLNCSKCHALAGAGGGIGPDLSAVGSSSPPDYIINSIMVPDQSIKEEFHTLIVLTTEGQVFQGIVADRDGDRIILKEATGERRTIPTAEVEAEKEGGSLMPKGLVNFMTRGEFLDLVRFLSELGKPGPYAIHSTPTIQRWRALKPVPEDLSRAMPEPETFRSEVLDAPEDRWQAAYAKVSGRLPLGEMVEAAGGKVIVVRGEIDVTAAGKVEFRLDSRQGVRAWLDDRPMQARDGFTEDLTAGRHKLTLCVDMAERDEKSLKVEVVKPEGSSAEFTVVDGK